MGRMVDGGGRTEREKGEDRGRMKGRRERMRREDGEGEVGGW